jgi:hypothetical protein
MSHGSEEDGPGQVAQTHPCEGREEELEHVRPQGSENLDPDAEDLGVVGS